MSRVEIDITGTGGFGGFLAINLGKILGVTTNWNVTDGVQC